MLEAYKGRGAQAAHWREHLKSLIFRELRQSKRGMTQKQLQGKLLHKYNRQVSDTTLARLLTQMCDSKFDGRIARSQLREGRFVARGGRAEDPYQQKLL